MKKIKYKESEGLCDCCGKDIRQDDRCYFENGVYYCSEECIEEYNKFLVTEI